MNQEEGEVIEDRSIKNSLYFKYLLNMVFKRVYYVNFIKVLIFDYNRWIRLDFVIGC